MRAPGGFFLIVGFVFSCSSISATCDPTSGLASPDQRTRDKAAALLRQTYTPAPKSRYDALPAQIRPGLSQEQLLALLIPYHSKLEKSIGLGAQNDYYRLDSTWLLHVWILMGAHGVSGAELVKETERFWVPAPQSFTGTWSSTMQTGRKVWKPQTEVRMS